MEDRNRTERELEKRISELERQLRRARRLESVGALAGGIAHDFNNILFLIVGYTEMCLERLPDEGPSRRYMEKVLDAAGRAKVLIGQLHSFSREEETEKRPVRFQAVVKESLKLLRSAVPATIRIEQRIDADCPQVVGDPVRLRQVLVALCNRTVAALGSAGGLLKVALEAVDGDDLPLCPGSVDRPGRCLRLSISGSSGADGAGEIQTVGGDLAVVREIVEDHGGVLAAASETGTGCRVFLPAAVQGETNPAPAPQECLKGSEHLLVVDDETELLDMVRTMLEKLGYEVTAAPGGREALEIFSRSPERFDLVATDLTMPDIAGPELAREMLRLRPELPIVLCSGFSRDDIAEQLRGIAIREIVAKPAACGELAGAIRRALG